MSSIELRGESRREIKFTDNGNNTCEIHISGPFASTAYALLDGGEMRRLQNWLTTHIGVPDQSPEPPASDEPAPIACTCTPCVTPGNGGPTPGHCAACCGLTGIEEYDPACPVVDHREMALRQFGAASDEPARCEGFSWIGQSFAHCDECGKPYWEHAHRREHKPGARLFTADSEVLVPITPDDAARVRAKWDAPGPAASGTPGGGL